MPNYSLKRTAATGARAIMAVRGSGRLAQALAGRGATLANFRNGLRYPAKIDMLVPSKDGKSLDLIVLDVGDIASPNERLEAFQNKLVSVANFVADGQYREHTPQVPPSGVTARFVCRNAPTPQMRALSSIRTSAEGEEPMELRVTVESETEFSDRIERELGVRPPSLFPRERPWWRFW